jgi:hypothetical protein
MSDILENIINEDGCPKCNSANVQAVRYTWWGGVIGPKILKHTKCNDCNFKYNSKTRKSNTTGIVIYSVVLAVISFAAFFIIFRNLR